jgi:predicted secreted protein
MLLKKDILIISVFLILCTALWAGDTASFVDLGFSPDGRTFMFGQYGVLSPSLQPWAEIFIVDVSKNEFVPNGRASYIQKNRIAAGQDGSGALYQLVGENTGISSRYNINFQNQGQPLYISLEKNPSENGEVIQFRDFSTGNEYTARLIPSFFGNSKNLSSSFHIRLECRSGGQLKNYTVGNPGFVRSKIASYNIKKVLVDSHSNSIIFIIEMKKLAEDGYDIRYMVEALRL